MHATRLRYDFECRNAVAEVQGAAEIEPFHDGSEIGVGEVTIEDVGDGAADDFAGDEVGDLRVTTDYRDVWGDVLLARVADSKPEEVFPGWKSQRSGYFKVAGLRPM